MSSLISCQLFLSPRLHDLGVDVFEAIDVHPWCRFLLLYFFNRFHLLGAHKLCRGAEDLYLSPLPLLRYRLRLLLQKMKSLTLVLYTKY